MSLQLGLGTSLSAGGGSPFSNGYSILFDGGDDYVDTGFQPDFIHSNATLSYWCKMADFSDTQIMGCHNSKRFYCGFNSQTVAMGVQDTNNIGTGADLSSFTTVGKWHHIAMVVSGGTATYYLDGIARDTMSYTQASASNPDTNFFIGGTSVAGGVTYVMEGNIDECAIFSSALSAAQILSIWNNGTPADLASFSPTSWWRMGDSNSGTGYLIDDEVATDSNALHLPGVPTNYASVPDAADLDGFTNFTLEAKGVTLADWTPAATQGLMSKYRTSPAQRSWRFYLETDGKLKLVLSHDGTVHTTYISTAANVLAAGVTADLMVMRNGVDIRFYVNGVQLGIDVTVVTTALFNSTEPVNIGMGYNTTANPFEGSIQRARVWNSAVANQATPTETPVLDVNFALANKGATSFTATSGQVVTVHSTAIDNPAAIRKNTDGILTNGAAFSPATPPGYSQYSILFDGGDEHVDCGIIDYSGFSGLTISCWAKVGDFLTPQTLMSSWGLPTSNNWGWLLFWGQFLDNKFSFLVSDDGDDLSTLNSSTALNEDQWYHVAVTWANTGNATIYIDGAADGTSSSMDTSIFDNDFKTAIGCDFDTTAEGVTRPMDGHIDEAAIFSSALSAAQILAIYNSGVPADLTAYSPVSWWRMGDSNDSSDGFIYDEVDKTLGSELITGFTNGTSYPLDTLITSGRDITSAIETSGNWGGCASNAISIVAGEVYEVTFDLTYNSGTDTLNVLLTYGLDGKSGGRSTYLRTNTDGTNTAQLSVTVTDATAYLTFQTWHETDVINFAATNVSLKKVGGGGNVGILTNGAAFNSSTP